MRAVVFRVLLIVATLVTIVVVGLGLVRHFATPAARKASGGNDFMPVWRPSVDYARAHEGRFPPLDVEAGRLMIDRRLMHEEFELSGQEVTADFDPSVPVDHGDYDDSPEHRANADLIDDHSWWYLGYRATNDDEGRAFLLGYLRAVLTNMSFGETLPVPEHGGLNPVPRLSLDPEILHDWDRSKGRLGADSSIPFLIERPGHYPPYTGGWVCYLDGHVEYIDYPGKWPMTKEFIQGLETIDAIGAMMTDAEAQRAR